MSERAIKLLEEALAELKKEQAKPTNPIQNPEASIGPVLDVPNVTPIKNQKLLQVPFALRGHANHKTRGTYRKGYPEGAIVHFTAGRSRAGLRDAINTAKSGEREGYAYFVIASTGEILQNHPLDRWGSHAGVSTWKGLGDSVSQYLVGIEVCCAGKLTTPSTSWFGETYNPEEIRFSEKNQNIQRGHYHRYTKQQEESLVRLLLFLKSNNESVFNFDLVLGHDEVSPARKNDPGASLSMTMPEFRAYLKRIYK